MAAVRAEFRVEVYVPDPGDPVFRAAQCAVDDCDRMAHQRRAVQRPRHPMAEPGAPCPGRVPRRPRQADPRPQRAGAVRGAGLPLRQSVAMGCASGTTTDGSTPAGRTRRTGPPTRPSSAPPGRSAACRSAHCGSRTPRRRSARPTTTGGAAAGCPDPDEYAADCQRVGTAHIDLRGLRPAADAGAAVRAAVPP